MDSLGNKNFIKNHAIPFFQSCYSITKLDTTGYYYTGNFGINWSVGSANIVKINNQGDSIFTKLFSSPINNGISAGFTIMPYLDTNLVVGGVQYNQPMLRYETLLVRANHLGDTLWTKLIIDTKDVVVSKLVQTKDQKIALIAARQDPLDLTKSIIWFLKCDENGDTIWTRMFKGIGSSKAENGLYCTTDSGFFICGKTAYFTPARLYIIKTDSMGNVATSQTINELSNMIDFSIFPNPGNGIFQLKLHILNKQANIEVYNIAGQKVFLIY
ncbi:MAG: T9SS type A sorting domain-containing protein [Bacteroidetes bacterium]|nr:T9SS type A sorting domain-containing protein [Bacteroidota bacterium]